VSHLQETKAAPPAGLEFLAELDVSAALLTVTNPLLAHPMSEPTVTAQPASEPTVATVKKKSIIKIPVKKPLTVA
jgi:hypothetical protein